MKQSDFYGLCIAVIASPHMSSDLAWWMGLMCAAMVFIHARSGA